MPTPDTMYDTLGLSDRLKPDRPEAKGPSPRTIERWRRLGKGPDFVRLEGRVAYRESAIARWLDAQTRPMHATKRRR